MALRCSVSRVNSTVGGRYNHAALSPCESHVRREKAPDLRSFVSNVQIGRESSPIEQASQMMNAYCFFGRCIFANGWEDSGEFIYHLGIDLRLQGVGCSSVLKCF